MSGFFVTFADLVAHVADVIEPVFHTTATAAAIVLFTACVRLLVLPLSRAAARGQRARARLAPELAELRGKYAKEPEKLQRAVMELHAREKVSPLSGCLPMLFQVPAFMLLYHVFSSSRLGGEANELLGHPLFAAPLGGRWKDALADGGMFGAPGLVYVGIFCVVLVVASFTYRRNKRQTAAAGSPVASLTAAPSGAAGQEGQAVPGLGAITRIMPFMSFMTLISVAVVPLAAALYIVTSTTWSAVERAVLYRDMPRPATGTSAGALPASAAS
ncbi:YidC/Oxa1 family membrane protein insertase [Streptomyces sp. NPDC007088]|uniref:YidC/Oxa1 family membrane protein insertase n=1 Tax=Streptomyces sp. NPDC007088 TaxID=3364773 RepID=UPI00368B831F